MKEILHKYSVLKECQPPEPFGNGHINDTYLVTLQKGKFILQRVNKNVFDTQVLIRNLAFLFEALGGYEKETGKKLTPSVIKNDNGEFHTLDNEGSAWRLMEFFPRCQSYAISPDKNISYRAAKATGSFQLFLNTLPVNTFGETIKNFHNPASRLENFLKAVQSAPKALKKQASAEIRFAEKNKNIAIELKHIPHLPLRVTHSDTKLDNILFTENGRVLIIDLDTIMPGYIMYDFGDMVRTFTSPAREDEPDISKSRMRVGHFEALTKGYLEPLKGVLSQPEKQYLLPGAKAIIYEQTLRFLSDFLLGNIYYKTAYPEHNLVRARTQIRLLEDILCQEDKLLEIIERIS